jgi:hypothetical protein
MNAELLKDHNKTKKLALVALRRAAAAARRLSRQTKTPFIVYQDGRIVDLNASKPRKPKPSAAD